jgi:hypothetical protein
VLLAPWQVALWSRTFGENRPNLAQELTTRFPLGKGARMIRAVVALSYPLIVFAVLNVTGIGTVFNAA